MPQQIGRQADRVGQMLAPRADADVHAPRRGVEGHLGLELVEAILHLLGVSEALPCRAARR